ncbi:MAG: AraC family transcriptional regulator ligand-binding domain-containing protein [Deltaproteobacteria bacterium]|nr:AraC family transcriptional regulator ligand-binding domain-containing protein [Deltaproteobacteria bacterium]
MGSHCTESILTTRVLARAAQRQGVDPKELLGVVGLAPDILEDPQARISCWMTKKLFETAARMTGNPALGLSVAEEVSAESLDVVGFIFLYSATMGDAIRKIARYYRLLSDVVAIRLYNDGGQATVTVVSYLPDRPLPPQSVEAVLAMFVGLLRQGLGFDFPLKKALFQHDTPEDSEPHQRFFKCPVMFNQPVNSIEFDGTLLAQPMVRQDPVLAALLQRHAEMIQNGLPPTDKLADYVRVEISAGLANGEPTMSEVAGSLGIKPRSLQHRLKEENTTFQEVLDSLRQELAMKFLLEKGMAVSDVAFLLGFSEPSPFHRAFRRWTGKSPSEFREQWRVATQR